MSLISKLKAVVAGDEYLDDDFDELNYPSEDELNDIHDFKQTQKNTNSLANSNPFDFARAFEFFGFCLKLLISFNSSSEA